MNPIQPLPRYLLIAGLLGLLIFGIFVLTSSRVVPKPMPNPNGYELLVQAGLKVIGSKDFKTLDPVSLSNLVRSNRPAIEEARAAFQFDSQVPRLMFSTNHQIRPLDKHLEQLPAIKAITAALLAESELARLHSQVDDGVRVCIDLLHVARIAGRGGLVIDSSVAVSVESQATRQIEIWLPVLSTSHRHQLAEALEDLNSSQDSFQQVTLNEKRWARETYGWRAPLTRLLTYRLLRPSEQRFQTNYQNQQQRTRALAQKLRETQTPAP